jgi:hypothetical protein
MCNGTPKSLKEAIMNGLEQFMPNCGPREELALHIEPHITDFLSQKFGVAMLTADEDYTRQKVLADLFFSLTGRKVK